MVKNIGTSFWWVSALGLLISAGAARAQVDAPPLPVGNFLVMGGGHIRSHNEIALEKNILYFQRTMQVFGIDPARVTIYFANGNDGRATVRYVDEDWTERFKVPEIPSLRGPSTWKSFEGWLSESLWMWPHQPVFIYFTGHGLPNERNLNNNYLLLWSGERMYVKDLARGLELLPRDTPVVAMMSQCFAGSFANFIYEDGNPRKPLAQQPRCGFFATLKSRTSVGCTPEVDEADYRDYSSSFFAGLSGYSRTGQAVASADHDQDGRVSYAEAHAFAKVDEQTTDLPVSTSEIWLRRQARSADEDAIAATPILELMGRARPHQRYVVESLLDILELERELSWEQNLSVMKDVSTTEVSHAYATRLWMELLNIGMEEKIRERKDPKKIAVLDRLLACESGSWTGTKPSNIPVATGSPEAPRAQEVSGHDIQ
jgi:hypothetical protein